MTTGLIHFLLALPVLVIFILIDGVQLTPLVLFLPVLNLIQFALTVGLAYFLAALNVTFRDTQHTLGVVLQLLFYLTPIFYELSSIPDEYWFVYGLNPMVHIVTSYRQILIWGVQPDWFSPGNYCRMYSNSLADWVSGFSNGRAFALWRNYK